MSQLKFMEKCTQKSTINMANVTKSQILTPSSVQRDIKKDSSTAQNQIDDEINAFLKIR